MQHGVLDVPSMGCLAGSGSGCTVAGEHRTTVRGKRDSKGTPSQLEQWDADVLPGTGNSRASAPAPGRRCGRDQNLSPTGTTPRSCCCCRHRELRRGSARASTLPLRRAFYLPCSLAVPRSYLRILILVCFRIRYILALQHCAAMTTGLHFCCFHTLVFLVLGLFPSSYSLALKT